MIEFYNSRAIYLQIADHMLRQILLKELRMGDRISSVREMAADIEVNPNTIAKSYNWLADQGVIQMHRGVGYFITDSAHAIAVDIVQKELKSYDLPKLMEKAKLLNLSLDQLIKNYKYEEKK